MKGELSWTIIIFQGLVWGVEPGQYVIIYSAVPL